MKRTERLTAVLIFLQDRPRTCDQIAEAFEVSRRTVMRDIQALNAIGVPVMSRDGPNGGYWLSPEYRVEPLPLTHHEALLLLLALRGLSKLSDSPFSAARHSSLPRSELRYRPRVWHRPMSYSTD